MQQVTLQQILSGLGKYFQSIDIRAAVAVTDAGVLVPLLVCVRISPKPVQSVKAYHAVLMDRFGPRKTVRLKILWTAAPASKLKTVLDQLERQKLTLEKTDIRLARSITPANFHASVIVRIQHDLQPATRQNWPSVLFAAGNSPIRDQTAKVYQDPQLVAELVKATRFRLVDEFVGAFLEVMRPNNYDRDTMVQAEMPARIREVKIVDAGVDVELEAEKRMGDLGVVLEVRDQPSAAAGRRLELELEGVSQGDPFKQLRASAKLDSLNEEQYVVLVLRHLNTGLELDEESGSVWRFMAPEEKSPLVECVRLFGGLERLRDRVERGLQGERAPQELLQRVVGAMFSLLGFTCFDFEQDGILREPGTGVGRATLDVIAYDPLNRIVLATECTLNVPKSEDYDKLLNAAGYLEKVFSPRSRVRVIPLLASMQESEPVQREEAGLKGIRIFNAEDLRALLRLAETGDSFTFLRFLEWPMARSLRDFVDSR